MQSYDSYCNNKVIFKGQEVWIQAERVVLWKQLQWECKIFDITEDV